MSTFKINHEDTKARRREEENEITSYGENTSPQIERVTTQIVDAAFKVHAALGPGLLESVYEICLAYELTKRGLNVLRQVRVPIIYDGQELDADLRLDLLVEDFVIVEVKA